MANAWDGIRKRIKSQNKKKKAPKKTQGSIGTTEQKNRRY